MPDDDDKKDSGASTRTTASSTSGASGSSKRQSANTASTAPKSKPAPKPEAPKTAKKARFDLREHHTVEARQNVFVDNVLVGYVVKKTNGKWASWVYPDKVPSMGIGSATKVDEGASSANKAAEVVMGVYEGK